MNQNSLSAVKAGEIFSYIGNVSEGDLEYFEKFLSIAGEDLASRLGKEALGNKADIPWASIREGNTINVVVPLTIQRGDTLAELLAILASRNPSTVVSFCNKGWVEPCWSALASRQLNGIIAALQGPPESFAHSSSPTDLTRTAIWIEACNMSLSKPGGQKGVRGSVIPGVTGEKSAAKYLNSVFATLRGCFTDQTDLEALKTLELLIKTWARSQEEIALSLIRKQKIAWGDVLKKGAPHRTKREKGVSVKVLDSPIKPSRSPWLSGAERQEMSHLYADVWSAPDKLRKLWISLSAEEQHSQFEEVVSQVRESYVLMNSVSQGALARLGHRKQWIFAAVTAAGKEPKSKERKKDPFTWSTSFFKLDLFKLRESAKMVFCPAHVLGDKDNADEILTRLYGDHKDGLKTPWPDLSNQQPTKNLFKHWLDRFQPNLDIKLPVPTVKDLETENYFDSLVTDETET